MHLMKKIWLLSSFLFLVLGSLAHADNNQPVNNCEPPGVTIESTGSYYDWARSQNGWGNCYQWTTDGHVLNGGQPVSAYLCEANHPTSYRWARAQNGWGACYQYTPNGYVLNNGQPVSNYLCEAVSPSYYSWAQSQNGQTYCYQYTSNGYAMNNGQPVSNYLCQ